MYILYVLPYIGVKISPKAAKKKNLFADRTICPLCVDFNASNRTSKQYRASTICQLRVPLSSNSHSTEWGKRRKRGRESEHWNFSLGIPTAKKAKQILFMSTELDITQCHVCGARFNSENSARLHPCRHADKI